MSVVVLAYHQMGHTGLSVLLRRGVPVSAVFSYEDDPGENCWFDSVAELARENGIPVHMADDINQPRWVELIAGLAPDVIFSFYYRDMVKQAVRSIPRFGAFNMHGSLLPKYRGRSPLNWQLVNGEAWSGVTLHHMVASADAGDIVGQERIAVGPDETALELYTRLNAAADRVLDRHLDDLLRGTAPRTPQDHAQATVFGGRRPADGLVDWSWPARRVHDLVRAVAPPWPGAFAELPDGRLMVLGTARLGSRQPVPADLGALAPGRVARRGARVFVGTADEPIELTSWQSPGDRGLRDDEQCLAAPPPSLRQEASS